MTIMSKTLLATVATATLALGVTAPASAQAWNDRGYERGYDSGFGRERGWHDGDRFAGNPRRAIEQCTRAAMSEARGNARVTGISDVDRTRDGFRIRGEIATFRPASHWGGWNRDHRDHDRGSFTCKVAYGRVVDLDFHGLRG